MSFCSRVLCWRILQIYLWGQGQCKIYVLWRHVLRLLLQSVLLQRHLVSIELSCIFSGVGCHKPQVLERHPKFVKYVIRYEIDYIYSLSLPLSLSLWRFISVLPSPTGLPFTSEPWWEGWSVWSSSLELSSAVSTKERHPYGDTDMSTVIPFNPFIYQRC